MFIIKTKTGDDEDTKKKNAERKKSTTTQAALPQMEDSTLSKIDGKMIEDHFNIIPTFSLVVSVSY